MSLNELQHSSREDLTSRAPRWIDIGILRDLDSSDVHDYASQDFLVFLGRMMSPGDAQLSYLIPFFEAGGLRPELDTNLQAEGTFESLSDAYWRWVRNQGFEKTVSLGEDGDGNPVPEEINASGPGTALRKS